MKITVYGAATPALVSAGCLADIGNEVVLVAEEIPSPPYAEPGLRKLLQQQQEGGRLRFTQHLTEGAEHGEIHYLLLDPRKLPLAEAIVDEIAGKASQRVVVVNRTAFPLGSSQQLQQRLQQQEAHPMVVEPDFMTEGRMIQNFRRPDRILLGAEDEAAIALMRDLYSPYNRNRDVVMVMSPRSAELTKFAANAMLATRISFMNEMADVAESLGADIEEVRQGMGSDHRIGYDYLYPGTGFGGANFAKDVSTLAKSVRAAGSRGQLLDAVLEINEQQREVLFRKAWRHFGMDLKGKRFAIWGVAYKPGSSDIRHAPAIALIEALLPQGAEVVLYDPEALDNARHHFADRAGVHYAESAMEALQQADALMVVTEWKPFWSPDFEQMKRQMKQPLIFDGRNLYSPTRMKALGFTYYGVGRGECGLSELK